ncbi:immunity 49 family protein [Nocardiopsis sp. NPDC058631]|uniref:immunity 49 family protein n=1 Tax=Nocardiopsis sp. NPDC058631 TaxID=3346566 RepID=UPI00364EA00B
MFDYAKEALVADPEAGKLETWEAWVALMQYYGAAFAATTGPKGVEVTCRLGQQTRTITGIGPRYFSNAGNWEMAFYLAVTCRDKERVEALCSIPVDFLRQAGESDGAQYNQFTYHWVAALQAYVRGSDDLVGELRQAMELSDPRNGAFGGEYLNLVSFPQMDVFRCLLMGDSDKFNEALTQGLEWFRDYYGTERPGQSPLDGQVPLGLLALACLGYDRNQVDPQFRFEVESDYLPKHIVENSWRGEFPI